MGSSDSASKADLTTSTNAINSKIQQIQADLNGKIVAEIDAYRRSDAENLETTLGKYAKATDIDHALSTVPTLLAPYAKTADVQNLISQHATAADAKYAKPGDITNLETSLKTWAADQIKSALPTLTAEQIVNLADYMVTNNALLNNLSKIVSNTLATTPAYANLLRGPPGTVGADDFTFGKSVTVPGTFTANGDAVFNKGGKIPSKSVLEFGNDIPVGASNGQKEANAGKIGYNAFDGTPERPNLSVVGAGKSGQSRKVKLWDDLHVTGTVSMGSDGADGKFQMVPGKDNWVRLFNKGGDYGDMGFATSNLWSKTVQNNPNFTQGLRVPTTVPLEFGSDVPVGDKDGQKDQWAGRMSYNAGDATPARPNLGIVGGGKAGQSRKVKLWDDLQVTGNFSMGQDGAEGRYYFIPGAPGDNWVRLFDKTGSYGDMGFAAQNLWGKTMSGNPSFREGAGIPASTALQFGNDVPVGDKDGQRENNAGKIGYNTFDGTAARPNLSVVGAGKAGQSRKVKLWDELQVTGSVSMGNDGVDGKFYLVPGDDPWVRLFNKAGNYNGTGFAAENLWAKNMYGNPNFKEGLTASTMIPNENFSCFTPDQQGNSYKFHVANSWDLPCGANDHPGRYGQGDSCSVISLPTNRDIKHQLAICGEKLAIRKGQGGKWGNWIEK